MERWILIRVPTGGKEQRGNDLQAKRMICMSYVYYLYVDCEKDSAVLTSSDREIPLPVTNPPSTLNNRMVGAKRHSS